MKPALHRSVWFWLGCFVLVFLVWAWVDSWKARTTVRRDWAIGATARGPLALHADLLRVDDGRIRIQWCRTTLTDPTLKLHFFPVSYRRTGTFRGDGIAMLGVFRSVNEETKGARVVRDVVEVPIWGIVGSYLLLCGGVLVWRRRRWRKVLLERERVTMEGVKA